jgi:formylglycine-generating enzyme required for sulfatase activity
LLLAGVHPAESQKFAHWLGNGYKLPTVEQWRSIDRELLATPLTAGQTTELESSPQLSRSARQMLHCILKHSPPNWAGLALMRGGLLEWVSSGPMTYGGLGVPRPQYYSLIINPQRDRPVTPLRPDRNKVFGFRLVRSLN